MKIRIVNIMTCFKKCKYFSFVPAVTYVKDENGSGIWICWLMFGLFIGNL